MVEELAEDEPLRARFLKACLMKLGLTVNQDDNPVPSLSRLHISSLQPSDVSELLGSLKEIIVKDGDEEYIKGENDTFQLHKPSIWSTSTLSHTLEGVETKNTDDEPLQSDRILDYDKIVKHVVVHDNDYPSSKETVSFNHHAFFSNLKYYQSMSSRSGSFGKYLLYGEVVSSTSTMLEK